MWNAVVLCFLFIYLFLIFSNCKLTKFLIVIDLLVRAFSFCKNARVIFLSEIHMPLFNSFLLLSNFSFYQRFIKSIYHLRWSKPAWICRTYIAPKFSYETYNDCYFFMCVSFPLAEVLFIFKVEQFSFILFFT